MARKTLTQVALEDMRRPGAGSPYRDSYAVNEVRPLGRRANGNFSTQYVRALLVQGRYPTAEGFTTSNPDYELELEWNGPAVIADLASRSWGEILTWNHIYCTDEFGTTHAPGWINNSRALWFGFETWLRSKATGQWSRIVFSDNWNGHPISPTFVHEDFAGTWKDFRTEANGLQSVRLMYDNNAPYASSGSNYWAFHGYSGGVTAFTASDVADVLVFAKVSLVVHDATAADDRAFTKYAVSIGADYYPSPRIYLYPSVGVSRHKLLKARWPEWQYIVMHTMTEAQLDAIGLPSSVASALENFDEGGVAPPVVPPAGPAPSKGRWLDVYTTSPRGRWVDITPGANAVAVWSGSIQLTASLGVAFSYTHPRLVSGTPAPTFSKVSGPSWASVNASTGAITGTPTGSPTSTSIVVRASNTPGTADVTLPLNVIDGASVTTASLPAAVVGTAYSATLAAAGVAPYAWAITSGTLPAGLTLSAETIAGTPSAAGTSTFTVQVTDALGRTATRSLSILVGATADAPSITTTSLADGTVGVAYHEPIAVSGAAPIAVALSAGTLPPGLSLLYHKANANAPESAFSSTAGWSKVDGRETWTLVDGGLRVQASGYYGGAWRHFPAIPGTRYRVRGRIKSQSHQLVFLARSPTLWPITSESSSYHSTPGTYEIEHIAEATTMAVALHQADPNATSVDYQIDDLEVAPLTRNMLSNPSAQGAVAGTPGTKPTDWGISATYDGLSTAIVGRGQEIVSGSGYAHALPYLDLRLYGTSATTYSFMAHGVGQEIVPALSGQLVTGAVGTRVVAGALPTGTRLLTGLRFFTAGYGALTTDRYVVVGTSAYARTSVTHTAGPSTAFGQIVLLIDSFAAGTAVDFTLRIYAPQMELGATATPYVDPRYAYIAGTQSTSRNLLYAPWRLGSKVFDLTNHNRYSTTVAINETSYSGRNDAIRATNTAGATSLLQATALAVPGSSTNDYYVTIYAKKGNVSTFTFNCYYFNGAEDNVTFNFDTLAVSGVPYAGEYIMQSAGSGWYRCGFRMTRDPSGLATLILFRAWETGRGNGVAANYTLFADPQIERAATPSAYIDPWDGAIAGTPTQTGAYGFVANASNTLGTAAQNLLIRINPTSAPVASPWAKFIRQ